MANKPEAAGDLAACTATEIARLVGAREASPVEVAQAALDRIDPVNDPINAVVTITAHSAVREEFEGCTLWWPNFMFFLISAVFISSRNSTNPRRNEL